MKSHLARFYITSDMVVVVSIEYVEISLITTLVMRDFALHDMWPFCICDYLQKPHLSLACTASTKVVFLVDDFLSTSFKIDYKDTVAYYSLKDLLQQCILIRRYTGITIQSGNFLRHFVWIHGCTKWMFDLWWWTFGENM